MTNADVLWNLEERFWTGGGDSARGLTATGAVMVFPYPAGILQGDAIWESMAQAPRWRSVLMSDRVMTRQGGAAVLAYRASAEREGVPVYEALCASTYLRDEDALEGPHWVVLLKTGSSEPSKRTTSMGVLHQRLRELNSAERSEWRSVR